MLTTFHLSELEPSISLAHTHAKPAFQTLFLQGPSQDGRTITMLGTVLMMSPGILRRDALGCSFTCSSLSTDLASEGRF